MTDLRLFRVYEPHELGRDGYPEAWHRLPAEQVLAALEAEGITVTPGFLDRARDGAFGIKDIVRRLAGERCLRCGHPYTKGESAVWAAPPRVERAREDERGTNSVLAAMPLPDDTGELPPDVAREAQGRKGLEVLYSACDDECCHGGPARWRSIPGDPWKAFDSDFDVSPLTRARCEVQAEYRILTVHHLNGRKHDCRWWNLAALCQRCHLVIQRKVTMERVYPFEHTRWFQPFAAGWYAHAYLGEDLTRAEVEARLGELLALERLA